MSQFAFLQGEWAAVFSKARVINTLGNRAVHGHRAIPLGDAMVAVRELFHVTKTKFWQMFGRGTRLCSDLFGPRNEKEFFCVFDHCQNLEYFSRNIPATDGALGESLGKRLFTARLDLIEALDRKLAEADRRAARETRAPPNGHPESDDEVRMLVAALLQREVVAMNRGNFLVRPRRRIVEKYARRKAWAVLSQVEDGQAVDRRRSRRAVAHC